MHVALKQHQYTNTLQLPLELYPAIFDNLDRLCPKDRRKALKAASLSCKLFRGICQPKLFEVLRIPRGNHFFIPPLGHPASSLLAILQNFPHLHQYIKAIHISNGGSSKSVGCGVCDRNIAAVLGLLGDLRQLVLSSRDYSDEKVVGLRWNDLDTKLTEEITKRCQSGAIAELFLYDMTIPYKLFYPSLPSLEALTLSSVELFRQLSYDEPEPRYRRLQPLRRFNIRVADTPQLEKLYSFMKSVWWTWDLTFLVEFTLHIDIPGSLWRSEVATFFSDILHKCLGTLECLTIYVRRPDDTPSSLKGEFQLLHQAPCLYNFELRATLDEGDTFTSPSALQSIVWYTSILSTIPTKTREIVVAIELGGDDKLGMTKDDQGREEWDHFASALLHLAKRATLSVYFLVLPWSPLDLDTVRSRLSTLLAGLLQQGGPVGLQLTVIPGEPGCLWWRERRKDLVDSFEPIRAIH